MFAEPAQDDLVGVVLGEAYQLVGRIGAGGIGVVYEAHHLRLHKRVAVKLLNQAHANKQEALERFHREALLASRLGHPHLVQVIDFGATDTGQPFMIMEFLEGEDLDQRIRRTGPLPLPSVVHIVRQTASAVATVHAKGIIHRDLKPANIFLVHLPGEPDHVKVLDFGISTIRSTSSTLTRAGRPTGTLQYMAPEQVAGAPDDVGQAIDQWALACIVWEMLAGRPPFHADSSEALFNQVMNLPPPALSDFSVDLPPGVEPVLLRALSKSPADRFPSVRTFARVLEAAVSMADSVPPTDKDPTVAYPTTMASLIAKSASADSSTSLPLPATEDAPPKEKPTSSISPVVIRRDDASSRKKRKHRSTGWMAGHVGMMLVIVAFTVLGAVGGIVFVDGKTAAVIEVAPVRTEEPGAVLDPGHVLPPPAPDDQSAEPPSEPVEPMPAAAPIAAEPESTPTAAPAQTQSSPKKKPHLRKKKKTVATSKHSRAQRLTVDDF